jgi:hypothetical protein
MMLLVALFLVYSAFCFWVIVLDGAETLEGWKSFFLLDWFAASLTPTELKFYVGISWLAGLVLIFVQLFSGSSG